MPLTVDYPDHFSHLSPVDEANIVAVLKHTRRVRCVEISASLSFMSKVATVMQQSFPALTHLVLKLDWSDTRFVLTDANLFILPKGFLNESAPCLQYLSLERFLIPEVPTFLLSSHNLVTLKLESMFQASFISPKAMVECLSGMTRLKTLSISFGYDATQAAPDPFAIGPEGSLARSDLTTRIILPSLTHFRYVGHSGYSEDLMAQIDAPLLTRLGMSYDGNHFLGSQIQGSQLSRFIGHIENFDQPSRAKAYFHDGVTVDLDYLHRKGLEASFSIFLPVYAYIGQQILDTVDFLGELFTTFSSVNHLSVKGSLYFTGDDDMGTAEWLPFIRLFPAVEGLQLSGAVGADIASSLEGTTEEMVNEVFPTLHAIWIDDEDEDEDEDDYEPLEEESMEQFLSWRQSSGHPVTIVNTQEELEEKLEKLESHRNGQENVL